MGEPWRSLALAAALNVVLAAGVATAQTVVVIGAPRGSTVELLLNGTKIGTATVDASGNSTFPLALFKPGAKSQPTDTTKVGETTKPTDQAKPTDTTKPAGKTKPAPRTETTARVSVDACDTLRRVQLLEANQELPPAGPGCTRKEFSELFILRSVTTIVVDVFADRQAVWARQGKAPAAWFSPDREGFAPPPERRPSPKGLTLSGGGGVAMFADAVSVSCGNSDTCSGSSSRPAISGAVAYWFSRFLGAEAGVVKPSDVKTSDTASTYSFTNTLETLIFTFAGKGGYAYGPIRFYGQGGATYSRTLSITNETFKDYSYSVDNVTHTLAGGQQLFSLRTGGWGWMFGGGAEYWVTSRIAVYGEFSRLAVKGSNLDAGEGKIDDRVTHIVGGVRLNLSNLRSTQPAQRP